MPRKLQTWAVVADGRNRLVVATESRREAARLCGVSDHFMREYGNVTGNEAEVALTQTSPGFVYTQPLSPHGSPFTLAKVTPYKVRHVGHIEPLREVVNDRRTVEDCRAKWEGTPHREFVVKGKPMADLTGAVMQDARMSHMTAADVRLVLHVLDDIGAGLVPPVPTPTFGDAIARSKRILALVDDYHDRPTADTRTALRKALMDEFLPPSRDAIVAALAEAGVNWQWVGFDKMTRTTCGSIDESKITAGVLRLFGVQPVSKKD